MKKVTQDGVDNEDYQILNMLLDYKLKRLDRRRKFYLSQKLLKVKELKGFRRGYVEKILSMTGPKESHKAKDRRPHYKVVYEALRHLGKTGDFPENEMRQVADDLFTKNEVGRIRPIEPVLLINKMFNIPPVVSLDTLKQWAA